MLFKRGGLGKGLFFFLIVILLAVGVAAVTIEAWTYVEGGTKNPSAPVTSYGFSSPANMYSFAECTEIGQYARGYELVRVDSVFDVRAKVICEDQGENITFTVNDFWSGEVSRYCTIGHDNPNMWNITWITINHQICSRRPFST